MNKIVIPKDTEKKYYLEDFVVFIKDNNYIPTNKKELLEYMLASVRYNMRLRLAPFLCLELNDIEELLSYRDISLEFIILFREEMEQNKPKEASHLWWNLYDYNSRRKFLLSLK